MRDRMLRPYEEVYKRRPMEVCEICGAMLFIDDAPQRLDDHIQGKQHVGYARIRAYIAERQKKREEVAVCIILSYDRRISVLIHTSLVITVITWQRAVIISDGLLKMEIPGAGLLSVQVLLKVVA